MFKNIQEWISLLISGLIVVPFFVYFVVNQPQYPEERQHSSALYHQEYVPVPAEPTAIQKKKIDDASLDCMAKNIYFEAQNQVQKGKEAVAFVVINRLKDPGFPGTICQIVHQKIRTAEGKVICEFSWVCENKPHKIVNQFVWSKCFDVALNILSNYDKIKDPTHGAKYYHTKAVHPEETQKQWQNKIKTAEIQDHIFFKDKKKG